MKVSCLKLEYKLFAIDFTCNSIRSGSIQVEVWRKPIKLEFKTISITSLCKLWRAQFSSDVLSNGSISNPAGTHTDVFTHSSSCNTIDSRSLKVKEPKPFYWENQYNGMNYSKTYTFRQSAILLCWPSILFLWRYNIRHFNSMIATRTRESCSNYKAWRMVWPKFHLINIFQTILKTLTSFVHTVYPR